LHYDAYWYFDITNQGYVYIANAGNNLAFFPAFPVIWSALRLTPLGISIFNCLLFFGSFVVLFRNRKLDYKLTLILLSIPSFIFFAVPYAESLFFACSVLIIVGYRNNNNYLLYLGLFAASTIRPVGLLFGPAVLICELLCMDRHTVRRETIKRIFCQLVACLSGFLLASAYMGYKSGKWFYFIDIQKYWYRHWLLPKFPLTTVRSADVLGLDAISFVIGVLGICYCFKLFVYKFNRSEIAHSDFNRETVFSAVIISGTVIIDTFFTYNLVDSTNIWSINRHLLCTPFAITFLIYFYVDFKPQKIELVALAFLLLSGIFFTGVFGHLTIGSLGFYLLFFGGFFLYKYSAFPSICFLFYYLIAVFLQAKFYADFLSGLWIG
jgi:hypothetical protein